MMDQAGASRYGLTLPAASASPCGVTPVATAAATIAGQRRARHLAPQSLLGHPITVGGAGQGRRGDPVVRDGRLDPLEPTPADPPRDRPQVQRVRAGREGRVEGEEVGEAIPHGDVAGADGGAGERFPTFVAQLDVGHRVLPVLPHRAQIDGGDRA
ncbi:hypothetical protein [Streptomyces sp. MB09-02B]|uniref:hypothetical protein n=1 Tax=Streptomyces sp. MB09-02B TaxID=3028667 RepID=UPI0029B1FDE5|nr:hypothetical protein [Streptomyces sp. MB09-02B]MDX3638153.1 hypothetical protein [Streptomyces sp. MB09-02B]